MLPVDGFICVEVVRYAEIGDRRSDAARCKSEIGDLE